MLQEQVEYYRARAHEYDQWFERTGRYDRGEAHRRAWREEVAQLEQALGDAGPRGDILELACGTGLWTRHLARYAERLLAVDASPETLELNRERISRSNEIAPGRVELAAVDLFDWAPPRVFDFVFFGFWLSHVPESRFDSFWNLVRAALGGRGRAFFVDSRLTQESTATDHHELDRSGTVQRKLNDGRSYRIVKVFHEPDRLMVRLTDLGFRGWVRSTDRFFLYGCIES